MISGQYQSGLSCNVLVLNKHYMAVRIVGARRAFSLLFRELAEVVSFEEGSYSNYNFDNWCEVSQFKRTFEPDNQDWVSTVNFHIAVPRIIRLLSSLGTRTAVNMAGKSVPPVSCHWITYSRGV